MTTAAWASAHATGRSEGTVSNSKAEQTAAAFEEEQQHGGRACSRIEGARLVETQVLATVECSRP
jgi:hypothetical protein